MLTALFCKIMLHLSLYELAIARTYSDNLSYVSALSQDVQKWESALAKAQLNQE